MTEHTPGPWKSFRYEGDPTGSRPGPLFTVGDSIGGGRIADNLEIGRPQSEAEANAHLIAAAPEMLDALETARVALNSPEADAYRRAALKEILAAQAKAQGGQRAA